MASSGEHIVQQLANDEGINVSTKSIIATVGAQEAMALVLLGLLSRATTF
jgi:aspartate/methionine/tyrosine aminotransferase